MSHSEIAWLTVLRISLRVLVSRLGLFRYEARLVLDIFLVGHCAFAHLFLVSLQHYAGVISSLITVRILVLNFRWRTFLHLECILTDDFVLLPQLGWRFEGEERYIFIGKHVINFVLEVKAVNVEAVDKFCVLRLLDVLLNVFIQLFNWAALFIVAFEAKLTHARIQRNFGYLL